jgi:hypothetical protein
MNLGQKMNCRVTKCNDAASAGVHRFNAHAGMRSVRGARIVCGDMQSYHRPGLVVRTALSDFCSFDDIPNDALYELLVNGFSGKPAAVEERRDDCRRDF